MFTVYILKSSNYNKTYVGQTRDMVERFLQHNSEHKGWTNRYKPWYIMHLERYLDRKTAIEREKYYKTYAGRQKIKKIIKTYSEIV